jgi:chlorophyllide a reductase subunit Y
LQAHGVEVVFRATLEQDLAAMQEYAPDLVVGTTPVVQAAKTRAIPSLYFTNLISARPLMGVAGAGSLSKIINTALGSRGRFAEMKSFFAGVGEGYAAGVWREAPKERPAVRIKQTKNVPIGGEVGAC